SGSATNAGRHGSTGRGQRRGQSAAARSVASGGRDERPRARRSVVPDSESRLHPSPDPCVVPEKEVEEHPQLHAAVATAGPVVGQHSLDHREVEEAEIAQPGGGLRLVEQGPELATEPRSNRNAETPLRTVEHLLRDDPLYGP